MDSSNGLALRKFVAPEFIFGAGSRALAGRYAKNLGARKVLVVTDPGVIAAGWAHDVIRSLEAEGLLYSVFSKVHENPRREDVAEGAEFYRQQGCNSLVAVGGGSVIDCAKGIGIVSTNHRPIVEFEGVDQVVAPMPPLVCVPTTGGTSADVSQFAIFSNHEQRVKFAIISKAVVPDVSLVDPETLLSMDAHLTACTGIDALVHAIEAFVSSARSTITNVHALEAIKLIRHNIIPSVKDLQNIELRSKVMMGSLQAGLAFSNASLGAVHAMAHSLGGLLDLPHGECNAMLLSHVMAFNFDEASSLFEAIGQAMGIDMRGMSPVQKKAAILTDIETIRMEAGILATLSKKGVHMSDVPELAKNALKDPCLVTNPRHANQRDIEVIYEEAL